MPATGKKLARSYDLTRKLARLAQIRMDAARERYDQRVRKAFDGQFAAATGIGAAPWTTWANWQAYSVDFAQRAVIFWDTMRRRGNQFLLHQQQGLPPVLHFDYETVLDARHFERPVNYALVRIVPPKGVVVDPARRPYVVIDPRAGHGPGVGGFKDDSQVGVALRAGHPVYFVIFFPEPEPGQTLLDVCETERQFVHEVRGLHPKAPKPAIVGNCQGGWAAMMLASSDPDETGPIVINGAPMSYWGGAWRDGEGDNPMRYAGGNLGGTWLASFTADATNGVFDGAWLVQNFENLNPANTYWDKYYHVFANADTEPERFLEFERWWGGMYLLNREEIEWITRNLFVGNKVWTGETRNAAGEAFDLRRIAAPIILFASLGDNITPPQQAFNWVADVYGSTEEIKARGQVIVGLLHEDVGHLGIFVSGRVAKKEHAQIVSVLEEIEGLPAGLYGMKIVEHRDRAGNATYDVEFVEHRLEDIAKRLNRLQRADEKPFEAVEAISEFNQRAYELFAQPFVQAMANDFTAKLARDFHPLRFQRWALSDMNPWLAWLGPAAEMVKANRQAAEASHPFRRIERMGSEILSASLDYYRDVRDAASEAQFFLTYGNLFALYLADRPGARLRPGEAPIEARDLPVVKQALAAIDKGGWVEATTRVGALLARKGEPIPLSRVAMRKEIAQDYADLFPGLSVEDWRRARGTQEVIVRHEPELALETLPELLPSRRERERFVAFIERVVRDPRIQATGPTRAQQAMFARIERVLGVKTGGRPALPAPRRPATRRGSRARARKAR